MSGDTGTITVVTPTIPPRAEKLHRAKASVAGQTIEVEHLVLVDQDREGPGVLRQRGTERASGDWVCYLDDDDVLEPEHCERLLGHARETGADLVYPWFKVWRMGTAVDYEPLRVAGEQPFGRGFDHVAAWWIMERGNFIPVTVLVRRDVIAEVGWALPGSEEWARPDCEDWGTWQRLLRAGAKFSHLGERTWQWWMWGGNTSGRVDRW